VISGDLGTLTVKCSVVRSSDGEEEMV